jgi:L-methionine (R)-S-oxide reductase
LIELNERCVRKKEPRRKRLGYGKAQIDFGCVPCVSLSLTSILIIHSQLKRMENREQMKTADEIVGLVRELVDSAVPRDEVLRYAVQILKQERAHYNWVGIYLVEGDMLILHNYIGKPTEHTHIPIGRGVCGVAVADGANQIVGDVTRLDNYLACSVETRAEIVVLIRRGTEILGQIDIDSDIENAFTEEDEELLDRVADLCARRF